MMARTHHPPNFFNTLLNANIEHVSPALRALSNGLKLALMTTAGRVGLSLIVIHLTIAFIGSWLAPYSATGFHLEHQLEAPSSQFWLGTDQFGRDILSRLMNGAGSIIAISLAGTLLGLTLGTSVGLISAYAGGTLDDLIMRVMDGLMSFPTLLLALLVLTMAPPPEEWLPSWLAWNGLNVVLTIAIVFMPWVARVIRSATLPLKSAEFVQNARLRGEGTLYMIFVEILPNIIPVLVVEVSVRLSYAILLASSVGFLGLGIQPPSPDWGLMISEGRMFLVNAPWVALAPAVAISSLVVGVNLFSDGMRQAQKLPRTK
ncbi:MAG: ABC transporter permease [Dehalococcoidales bacterium]|jgi:peptide/nickel transport system permease protein|nr:ABC transporter permease [Dehalococcoidales bacterium]MDP7110260.1 ABC transporter permease [Dehalococcoidales bacterium]MDP7310328.1 ABC transporter permease [Dehalococcoidales bacterium]HJM36458.1 ABC transporter permease [Dehalococcoidales bacterium]